MEIKKFIDIHVPIFSCNLKCSYCYVGQNPQNKKPPIFNYSVETVKKALSRKRLGGICHFNVCGMGETLIPEKLSYYIRAILENGHTVMIVTNGTLTKRFLEYMSFPEKLKRHLGFKFSYHYLELKRMNIMETFWNNVRLVKENGCSFSVELTPNDSYEPYIEDIKQTCLDNIGALCHLSVPRDEATGRIKLYSQHSKEEFYNIWQQFDSAMFEFKMRHWEERRHEFCYAGLWSGLLNIGTGEFNMCYHQPGPIGNLFENPENPFEFSPVCRCELPHCFNSHSFMTWGTIPEIDEETYLEIRDRVDSEGNHWINEDMSAQFSEKLFMYNDIMSDKEKNKCLRQQKKKKRLYTVHKITNKVQRVLERTE